MGCRATPTLRGSAPCKMVSSINLISLLSAFGYGGCLHGNIVGYKLYT